MLTNLSQIMYSFKCECCDLTTNNKKDYHKHLMTAKHKKLINLTQNPQLSQNPPTHLCVSCNKTYKSRVGLWGHKKQCPIIHPIKIPEGTTLETKEKEIINTVPMMDMSLILSILQKNQEFQDMMMEQNKIIVEQNKTILELASKAGTTTNNNNNTTNNNNFNLHIFLNEKCKDAMNITDFTENIKVQLTDLEAFGTHGYCEGITRIFMRCLNELDICKRPIHCSDLKREIMYVKDKDAWEKDDERKLIKKAIDKIEHKNHLIIPAWQIANPEFNDYHSKVNDVYNKLLFEAMGGETKEENDKNYSKITRCIAKGTIITKNSI